MRNRLPTYPGRVHLAPVEGQANVFDLTRADQPQDPGTPLNKGTLLSDDVEALIWGAAADRTPNDAFGKVSELYQHWWSVTNSADETTYVHSPNRNTYPDSGAVDGLTYQYLGVPFDNARTAPKIEFGSYVGTGTYRSTGKSSITLNKTPKIFLVGDGEHFICIYYDGTNRKVITGANNANTNVTAFGTTIEWYNTNSARQQINVENQVYPYLYAY